jgi:heat shock protein HslJ
MKRIWTAFFATAFVVGAASQVEAKRAKQQQQGEEQQKQENTESGGIPRYQPFPHNQTFLLKDINGKTPPVEMWIMIDSNSRATGFSGCKNWSGVFIVGSNRLGPKAMPAVNEQKCDPALQAIERDYWAILLSGPFWDTQGSDLILKGAKGGAMRFTRSL